MTMMTIYNRVCACVCVCVCACFTCNIFARREQANDSRTHVGILTHNNDIRTKTSATEKSDTCC